MANPTMEILTKVLEQSAKLVEEQVDAQINKLNEMDEEDLERLKEKRLETLKKAQKQKQVCGIPYPFNIQHDTSHRERIEDHLSNTSDFLFSANMYKKRNSAVLITIVCCFGTQPNSLF